MRLYVLHPLLGIRVLTRSVLCPRHATPRQPDDRRIDEDLLLVAVAISAAAKRFVT